jgi:FAD/FMN-containing dehydrogenase
MAAQEFAMPIDSKRADDHLSDSTIDAFARRFRGTIVRPGDPDYDQARQVWNAAVSRHPKLIVRPIDAGDVIQAVNFARSNALPLAVRGGGHSPAGHGTVDDGLVIDCSAMTHVEIEPIQRVAMAQPGLTWGAFNARTQDRGLATPGTDVAGVGIAGTALGGGMSWLMRKHGMTIDNLLSVDLVTADGREVTASATDHPDLFWALRGGGGNFGIATKFQFRLHPIETVVGGAIVYPATREGLRAYADAIAQSPDELTTITFIQKAPPLPFVPEAAHGTPVHVILALYSGEPEAGEQALAPLRRLGSASPIADTTRPIPYLSMFAMTDQAGISRPHAIRNAYLRDLSDEIIEAILDFISRGTSPFSMVSLRELGGAAARVPIDGTAFAHRDKAFYFAIDNGWDEAAPAEPHVAWTESFWQTIAPYTDGAYAAYMGDEDRVRAAYPPATYARLAEIKKRYDPENLFRLNANIPLA